MAKQLGRSLLLKIGDGASPDVYTAFAGLNSKSLTVNNSAIDVTTPDATTPGGALWAESLNGLKAVAFSWMKPHKRAVSTRPRWLRTQSRIFRSWFRPLGLILAVSG